MITRHNFLKALRTEQELAEAVERCGRIKKERDNYKMWAIKLNNLLRREGWSQGEIDSAAFPDEEGAG